MNSIQLNAIIDHRLNLIKEVLQKKNNEYATSDDVFRNFKDGAIMAGKPEREILFYYMLKHFTSVRDMIFDEKFSKNAKYTKEYIEEKIGDIINYLIILEAMLKEKSDIAGVIVK